MRVDKFINSMRNPIVTKEEVIKQFKKLKTGKAPEPDDIKPELYLYLIENDLIIEKSTLIMNNIIDQGKVPTEWKKSITILTPKNKKPKLNELIALTNISYKRTI